MFIFGQALETCKINILNTENGKIKFKNFELKSCQYPLMPQFYIFQMPKPDQKSNKVVQLNDLIDEKKTGGWSEATHINS